MAAAIVALHMRRSLRKQRVVRDRTNPMETKTDLELYKAYRLQRHELLELCDDIKDDIEYPVGRQGTLPPILQVDYSSYVANLLI